MRVLICADGGVWLMSSDDAALLRTPLYDVHQAWGGRLVAFAGYALPVQYPTGILAEHQWVRTQAGLFDVSHMGQLRLCGSGAAEFLESLTPSDVLGLRSGRMRYSLLLNPQGGIIDDLMITHRGDDFLLVVNAATKHADQDHIQAHMPPSLSLQAEEQMALLALQGPRAVDALARLAPAVADLRFMQGAAISVAGRPAWISRSGYTGEDGFEIALAAQDAPDVAHALAAQPEVKPAGLGARDSLRLEAGLPLYGHDIHAQTTPVEADLSFAIAKRRKAHPDFPGGVGVMTQLFDGPARQRVGLILEGRQPAREGAMIYAEGPESVGCVTSGGFSPTLGVPIAMGYVARAYVREGTSLSIEVRGKRLSARIAPLPFVPHRYVRLSGGVV